MLGKHEGVVGTYTRTRMFVHIHMCVCAEQDYDESFLAQCMTAGVSLQT